MKKRVREILVVEGKYDKNAVSQVVDCTIIETGGFRIFSDKEKLSLLRRLAEKRGLIILTDADGAGFLIRGHLRGKLSNVNIKHAYIPDVTGREKRKRAPSKEGLLGVEGMTPEIILTALERAGATFDDEIPSPQLHDSITKADMYEVGLSGTPDSAQRRDELKARIGLPARLSASALLDVLNALYTREEFFTLYGR